MINHYDIKLLKKMTSDSFRSDKRNVQFYCTEIF